MATDHAPHTTYEKDREFDYAPFGILGSETCFAVTQQVLCGEAGMSIDDVVALLTYKPAELLKLDAGTLSDGVTADIAIFDLEGVWEVNEQTLFSKSHNTPWWGETLTGKTIETIVGGKTVFRDGKITG